MKIKVKENCSFAIDGMDVRCFKKGEEVEDLDQKNAARMVELNLASCGEEPIKEPVAEVKASEEVKDDEEPKKRGRKKNK